MLTRSLGAAVALLAACKVPDVTFVRATDAGTDVAPDVSHPAVFAPLHVHLPVLDGIPAVTLTTNPTIIDTTALAIDGATSAYLVGQRDDDGNMYAVLFAHAVSIQGAVRITGALPLIIVSAGPVTIAGDIDLAASETAPGPGALAGGPGAGGAGGTAVVANGEVRISGGGGGGSYGSLGAPGGGAGTLAMGGTSGATYGGAPNDPLVGGSPGGSGGNVSGAFGVGAGGGALQISSASSIMLTSGSINAGGGGGLGGSAQNGGGGGGAGGEIVLEAPIIVVFGVLAANGGGAGGGGYANPSGVFERAAGPGESGTATSQPAQGGVAGLPGGGHGGDGAAGVTGAFVDAKSGSTDGNEKAGGGGGGAGRVWLRFHASTPPDLGNATISPPPGMDATLP